MRSFRLASSGFAPGVALTDPADRRSTSGRQIPLIARHTSALILFIFALVNAGSAHAVVSGQCVQARGGNSCTAGDVTFVLVGLGNQTQGCVNTTGDVTMFLGGTLSNTAAAFRYDIGMYINTDSSGSAYSGTTCAREMLKPAYTGATGTGTCPPLDLVDGSGPFLNQDGDTCGDLAKHGTLPTCSGGGGDSFMVFPDAISFPCADLNPRTGFIQIPTCATWGNSANEVTGTTASPPSCTGGTATTTCNTECDVAPGTPSKCNCAVVQSNVPNPNLGLSCNCSPGTVRPGASTACTVSFTNAFSPACTNPTPTPMERFQCGVASFIRYKALYSTANGGAVLTGLGAPTETTGGTASDNGTGTITWTPKDTTSSGSTLGVIGANESGSMTYQYLVGATQPNGAVTQTVQAWWANASSFASEVQETNLTASCTFTVSSSASYAAVASFRAHDHKGLTELEWETAGEVGTVGFELEREEAGHFVKVVAPELPAIGQLPGGHYHLIDTQAPRAEKLTYRLTEIDQKGERHVFGPYQVNVERATRRESAESDVEFSATAKDVSARVASSAAEHNGKHAVTERSPAAGGNGPVQTKILVEIDGLTRVHVQDIANSMGMSIRQAAALVQSGALQLTHAGLEVAWQPAADGDGLVFYGQALHTAFTDTDVYWLQRGRGQQMGTQSAQPAGSSPLPWFPDTVHYETDLIPAVVGPVVVPNYWIWETFFPGDPQVGSATVSINVASPAAGPATLVVNLIGFAAEQRAAITVNGNSLPEVDWQGVGAYAAKVQLPAGALQAGANSIQITALEGNLGFWLDSFDLTYQHEYQVAENRLAFSAAGGQPVRVPGFTTSDVVVFDVSSPQAPVQLTGAAVTRQGSTWTLGFTAPDPGPFVASTAAALTGAGVLGRNPADLRNPGNKAQYVVITPVDFQSEAQRLANLRSAQGLSTMVVVLDDIMDVFNNGIYDPAAIRSFLATAVQSWQTPPRYVALAGKGSYDYRNLLGLYSNMVPPLLIATGDGLAPADGEYADFDGTGLPQLAIGRIPVLTLQEMHDYVDKVAAYEAGAGGAWTNQALLAADYTGEAGNFAQTSDELATTLPPGLAVSRVYVPSPDPTVLQASRTQLLNGLRSGQVMFNFVGHGGLDRIVSEGLLLTTDVPQMGNAPKLPVMTALTCLLSEFAYPTISSLGEDLVLQRDGGVAALYAPTWLSYNSPASQLGTYVLPQVAAVGGGRVGDRLLRGINAYAAAGGDRSLLRVYTLLGDPALVVRR